MKKRHDERRSTKRIYWPGPGVAVGPYRVGEVYEVEADEADRLIKNKGFREAGKSMPEPEPDPEPENGEGVTDDGR